jgi:hypothetical protein
MTNNVTINIDAGSGEANLMGDTKKAKELGIFVKGVVQNEIIRQKLPGGALGS